MPAFIIGGEIAVGPQPCYSTPPAPTYSCPAWTVEEKKLLSDKQQDVINGGPGSTERLLCANLRTRTYQYDAQFSPCKCRCCELVTTTPASVCFGAAGYVGIDPSNPKENWFYVQTKNLVVQNITNAFIDGAPKLPSVIAETGFPGTNTFSFSMVAEQTPIKGVTVRGF